LCARFTIKGVELYLLIFLMVVVNLITEGKVVTSGTDIAVRGSEQLLQWSSISIANFSQPLKIAL